MSDTVILTGARTPIGRFNGGLAGFSGTALGGLAIAEALARVGISGDQVDYAYMGQVVMAGAGQVPARQAAFAGGIPMTVPSTGLNKACPSGLNAIQQAHRMIALGEAEIVVAGGMESMTQAPYLLLDGRKGYGYGDAKLPDALTYDGLSCSFESELMGAGTERHAAAAGIGREEMDRISAMSHDRAARAQKDGLFEDEIVPVEIPQRKGDPIVLKDDEGIRVGTTTESLGGLRAAFADDGNVTAGNASQLSDGGAAVVVTTKAIAEKLGVEPLAEIIDYAEVAGPDTSLLTQPSRSTTKALDRAGMQLSDVDLFEFNEAFAAVSVASMAELGLPEDVVNVNGGAIALGHPIGMSGTRLAITLAYELKRRGGGVGAAALCGGGGQGDAMLLKVD
ncbi:MAG: acetyl-CoA C-acyltransferase [Acidimicrobiales bacterium]|nr:acetyl-CoA C-acyltransferase [Acidimicrobiales bacterium]